MCVGRLILTQQKVALGQVRLGSEEEEEEEEEEEGGICSTSPLDAAPTTVVLSRQRCQLKWCARPAQAMAGFVCNHQ